MRKFGWSCGLWAVLGAAAAAGEPVSLYGPGQVQGSGPVAPYYAPPAAPAAPAAAAPPAAAGAPCAADAGCPEKANCLKRLWEWLTYVPSGKACKCLPVPTPYQPPLYTYFDCYEGKGYCGAPCAGAKPVKNLLGSLRRPACAPGDAACAPGPVPAPAAAPVPAAAAPAAPAPATVTPASATARTAAAPPPPKAAPAPPVKPTTHLVPSRDRLPQQ